MLVRNPTFTLTFTHPEVVSAGEPYTLDVTVTNTVSRRRTSSASTSFRRNVSGATVVGASSREIESIPPGDSATVTFDLISSITGKVTAATLDSNENVAGRFALKTAVGELGVPLSPDSLVLPKEARSLPADLRAAAIGLLGKAWAVATAPAAALPKDVQRFSKKIVLDRAVEVAEAGFRVSLHEPLADSAAQLAMDFMGNKYAWLPQFNPQADDLAFEQQNFTGFDALRRQSVRGDRFADAVAAILAPDLAARGAETFHADLGQPVVVSAAAHVGAGVRRRRRQRALYDQHRRCAGAARRRFGRQRKSRETDSVLRSPAIRERRAAVSPDRWLSWHRRRRASTPYGSTEWTECPTAHRSCSAWSCRTRQAASAT